MIEKIKPIIFLNKPIDRIEDDLIGITYHTSLVMSAIEKGGSLIAITGDFGTGKSSIINLLSKEIDCLPIALYHSIEKKHLSEFFKNGNRSKELFVSFNNNLINHLDNKKFQLFSSKRMSKNYGSLEFGLNIFKESYIYLILSILFFLLPNISTNLYNYNIINNSNIWLNLPRLIYPFSNYVSVGFLFIFLSLNNFLFSLWDSQGKREIDIDDIILLNIEIVEKLFKKKNYKKKIIISIEDLDRISNKNDIYDFLKLIYRLNEIYKSRFNDKKVIFIISIKDEKNLEDFCSYEKRELNTNINQKSKNNENFYPKIFDYNIELKPIHISDFRNITLNLLRSENNLITKIPGFEDLTVFPEGIHWLIQGENLSIREVKDRLNAFFELYNFLRFREDQGYVSVESCAIIIYLERKYPNDFLKFIKHNNESSLKLNKIYVNPFPILIQNSFNDELEYFLSRRKFGINPRMYFYRFPKYEYISSIEEELLIEKLSSAKEYDGIIETSIETVLKNTNGLKTVSSFLLNYYENKIIYPESIYFYKNLIEIAFRIDTTFLKESLSESYPITNQNISLVSNKLEKIFDNLIDLNLFQILSYYLEMQLNINTRLSKGIVNEEIFKFRAQNYKFIKISEDLKNFLYSIEFPSVSLLELKNANSVQFFIDTYNSDRLTKTLCDSYLEFLSNINVDKNTISLVENIVLEILNSGVEIDKNKLVQFLTKQKTVNVDLLNFVDNRNELDSKNTKNYIELVLNAKVYENSNFQFDNLAKYDLSDFKIYRTLSSLLLRNGYIERYIETLILNNDNLHIVDVERDTENIINILRTLYSKKSHLFYVFRNQVLKNYNLYLEYFIEIFREPFPSLNETEIPLINNYEVFFKLFSFNNLEFNKTAILEKFITDNNPSINNVELLFKKIIDYLNTRRFNDNISIELIKIISKRKHFYKNLDQYIIHGYIDACYRILGGSRLLEKLEVLKFIDILDTRLSFGNEEISREMKDIIIRLIENGRITKKTSELTKNIFLDHLFSLKDIRLLKETGDFTNYLTSKILRDDNEVISNINYAGLFTSIFLNTTNCRKKILSKIELMNLIIDSQGYSCLIDNEYVDYYNLSKDKNLIRYLIVDKVINDKEILELIRMQSIDEITSLIAYIFNDIEILQNIEISFVNSLLSYPVLSERRKYQYHSKYLRFNSQV